MIQSLMIQFSIKLVMTAVEVDVMGFQNTPESGVQIQPSEVQLKLSLGHQFGTWRFPIIRIIP